MEKPNSRSHPGKQRPEKTEILRPEPARSAIRTAKATREKRAATQVHDPDLAGGQSHGCELVLDHDHGLAALVWKYFEAEIRDVFIEIHDSLGSVETDPCSE